MDQATINRIIFGSCLLGFGVGAWLLRWARRELAGMANERQTLFKRRAGLWGRRIHARALMAGGILILWLSASALLNLFFRR